MLFRVSGSLISNRNSVSLSALVPTMALRTVRAWKLLLVSLAFCLSDVVGFLGATWLTTRVPGLVIMHNRLVDDIRTVYHLALSSTSVLLSQQRDAVVHLKGCLRSRWHAGVLFFQHHAFQTLSLFNIFQRIYLSLPRLRIRIVGVFRTLLLRKFLVKIDPQTFQNGLPFVKELFLSELACKRCELCIFAQFTRRCETFNRLATDLGVDLSLQLGLRNFRRGCIWLLNCFVLPLLRLIDLVFGLFWLNLDVCG